MARYQITIRGINGKGWRIRPMTGGEFQQISREILSKAAESIQLADVQSLWPAAAASKWHAFGDAVFHAVLKSVYRQLDRGEFDVLATGRGVLNTTTDLLSDAGWKESTCEIGRRVVKILLSISLQYLRLQFPVIEAGNAARALAVLGGLIAQRSPPGSD
jgi:hypothetical protein